MKAVVVAVLWLGFSVDRLLFSSSGLVGSHSGSHGDRQRRSPDETDLDCGAVRAFLRGKGLLEKSSYNDQQEEPLAADAELKICATTDFEPDRQSCCTPETEHQLQVLSFADMRQVLSFSMTPVRLEFSVAINSFSEEFLVLLRAFENATFHILTNTFRIPAAEVQVLLDKLTSRLVIPPATGETQKPSHQQQVIRKVIGEFYDELFIVAVRHLLKFNVSAANNSNREGKLCLTELRMNTTLLPLGNYPALFEQHFLRSLGAALSFVWGLQVVSDYLNVSVNLDLADKCLQPVTRMTYCPLCQGLTNIGPCLEKCTPVLRSCLQSLLGVSASIRRFAAEAVESVQAELAAVSVFDAILPSMVSKSLLKVIETGHTYRNQIVKKCGFRKSNGGSGWLSSSSSAAIPSDGAMALRDGTGLRVTLERLRSILLQLSDLLVALPRTFCNSKKAPAAKTDGQCWNGTALESQNTAVEERTETEKTPEDIEIASHTDTAKQLTEITSMLQQIHRKTHTLKTQSKETAETAVQMTSGKTQSPPRLQPVRYEDAAATDDEEVDVDGDEDSDDQYSGGESGQRTIVDMPTARVKTIELTVRRPDPLSSSSYFIRRSALVAVLLNFTAAALVITVVCIAVRSESI